MEENQEEPMQYPEPEYALEDITDEQQEMLLQLQDLTGSDELDWCRAVLEEHSWDMDAAARAALDVPSAERGHLRQRDVPERRPRDGTILPWEGGLWRWLLRLAVLPLAYVFTTVTSIVQVCLEIIRGGPGTHDPVEDVSDFIVEFERTYGTDHPAWLRGSYGQALAAAKQQLKPLVVYLHCSDHQDTEDFCRETLRHGPLRTWADSSLLFWACSVNRAEGYRVSQALRENGYPFVAIIVLKDNKMTVVGRLEGPYTPEEFLQRLRVIVRDNEAALVTARHDRNERSLAQEIRQQQDVDYQESLRADQEKERRRQQERERQEQEQRELREQERERQLQKEETARLKVELASEIPDEPPLNRPDCVRISIKLPDGSRIERRFSTAHSLKVLYYVVFCHPNSPERFEITQNYPRRVLPCKPSSSDLDPPSLADAGLGKSELLYVRDLDA